MMRAPTIALAGALLALAVSGCGVDDPLAPVLETTVAAPPSSSSVPAPPTLTPERTNEQNRFTAREKRRHEEAYDGRPLIQHVPLDIDGLSIDVAGLADDNKTTILRVTLGARSTKEARTIYRRALRRFRDSGDAYTVEYAR